MKFLFLFLSVYAFADDCGSYENLTSVFFSKLDYDHEENLQTEIPVFEDKLLQYMECIQNNSGERSKITDAEYGILHFYVGLYLKNTIQGYLANKITLENMRKYRKFSESGEPKQEIIGRYNKIISLFENGGTYIKEDRRVPGWIAAAKLGLFFYQTGYVNDERFSEMLKAIDLYPEFNLFSGYLAFHNVVLNDAQKQKLVEYTDSMTATGGPCSTMGGKEVDPACNNSPKAPFNYQTSMVILGDIYFQKALANPNPNTVKAESIKANIIYDLDLVPNQFATTFAWNNHNSLFDRLKLNEEFIFFGIKDEKYWKKESAVNPYHCASCHRPNE